MDRRQFLQLMAATSGGLFLPFHKVWAASTDPDRASQKLLVVLLRGGVDGLNVVAPYGDDKYYGLRPSIAVAKPGQPNGLIDLDGHFGMHPALAPLLPYWQSKSLAFVHAAGSPDPSRSHFDAQDYMETGIPGAKNVATGWMNRLLQQMPSTKSAAQAVGFGVLIPRILSGTASVATVAPQTKLNKMAIDNPNIERSFTKLYAGRSDALGKAFADGVSAHKEIGVAMQKALENPDDPIMTEQIAANKGAPSPREFANFGQQISGLFRNDPSVQVAFVDFGGWDTHVNEGTGTGQLARHLEPLAKGLDDLIKGLGPLYKNTQIVVMSEFGRTAKENGNSGTDHGHGNVMWLLGNNIPGGKVYGRWAGLGENDLHEGRDLPTSTDFRSVLSSMVGDHMKLSSKELATIFPHFEGGANPFVQA
jgi:uncharacterized protein (DUF1501 family)